MPPYPLTNFEIQKYQLILNLIGVISRNNLPEIKDQACVINLDEQKSIRTHWIYLDGNGNSIVEYIPKKKVKIHRKQKYHNIYLLN